jgi:fatty acid elongase 3
MGKCAGEEFAAFAGIGTLTSYLFLFISFYLATYKGRNDSKRTRKALRRMSQAPLPDPLDLLPTTNDNPNWPGDAKTTGARPGGYATRSRRA